MERGVHHRRQDVSNGIALRAGREYAVGIVAKKWTLIGWRPDRFRWSAIMFSSLPTVNALSSLGMLRPGPGTSDKELASALRDVSATTDDGQPIASLLAGPHRYFAGLPTAPPFPAGLRSFVSVRSSPMRALDPLAGWTTVMRPRTTRGPFLNDLGETFWIDTFLVPSLVNLIAENALGQRFLIARLPTRGPLTAGARLRLGRGTVWLPARILVRGRAADEFVGVRITGGSVALAGPAMTDGDAVIVSGGWSLTLRLALDHADTAAATDGPGADATHAAMTMPTSVNFAFAAAGLQTISLPDSKATIYGSTIDFTRGNDLPFVDDLTRSVVVPLTTTPDRFSFETVKSEIWSTVGNASIERGGWALAIVNSDPNALADIDSAGSLWLNLREPLAVTWQGLTSPARSIRTVLTMSPGTIVVRTTVAPRAVTQQLQLWNENGADPNRRSTVELESTRESIVLHVSQPGVDGVLLNGRGVGHLDRPLAADGGRLAIRSATCWFSVLQTASGTTGSFLAIDGDAATRPHIAFALENAFLKVRPPGWLHVSGPLTDSGLESGSLLLRFQYRFVLPTLPDPYASSFDVPELSDVDAGWGSCSVTWNDPDTPALSFAIVPTAQSTGNATLAGINTTTFAQSRQSTPVLVDVSGNADQFGVTIPLGAGAGSSLQIAGMSLVAEARHVAVMTLPPISWEPMLTKTPEPGAVGDVALPPPPHDGGPALLTADVVELRPVAPLPLLATYHDAIRAKRHFNARLPLPFGLTAQIDSRGPGGDAQVSIFEGSIFFNRPTFDDALEGARQLALLGRPGVAGGRDFTFPGYLIEESQNDYAKGVLSQNVLDGVLTDFGRGQSGIPLKRYELSGYGATIFSDWRDPEAVGPAIVQARFDVLTGRTAHEVVQMQSALYPVYARVVRTITIDRQSGGWVLREDSGWVPTSDGRFLYKGDPNALDINGNPQPLPPAFAQINIHKGLVEGAVNIRNIRLNGAQLSLPTAGGVVTWQPVLYDADILFVTSTNPRLEIAEGSVESRVPCRNLIGWIQIGGAPYTSPSKNGKKIPRVRPANAREISDLLLLHGPATGPIDTQLLLGGTPAEPGMRFRAVRMDVSCAEAGGTPRLVAAVRGSPALPRDGAWSLARINTADAAPKALDPAFPVPVVRPNGTTPGNNRWHLADPTDILELADAASPVTRYGIVQSMGTQKVFFERPRVGNDAKPITLPKPPKLADVGALLNAAGIFPGLGDAFDFSAFDGFNVNGGELGFSKSFPILKGGMRSSAILADLGGSDGIQLVIDYEDEKQQATVATVTVNPAASPRWSVSLERVAFSVRFRGATLIRLFARVVANEARTPTVEDINVRYESVLQALQTIFTNVQQIARYLPGGAGAGLRVAFTQGHLTIQNVFALPNLPLGAGQITDIAVAMGLEVSLSPFDLRFIAGLGSSSKPFRWIVSPLAGTGVVQVGIGSNGLDILVQGGLGLGLAIDLGIAAGSASIALALELNTGPDPFEIKAIISGRASVDVLRGLASATITLAAGLGIIPPKELLKPPFLPPSLPPPAEIPSFTIGFTASVSVGIHLTVCWVVDVDFDDYWQFRQDIKTPAIPIPQPF
jgi:hypothetical protein